MGSRAALNLSLSILSHSLSNSITGLNIPKSFYHLVVVHHSCLRNQGHQQRPKNYQKVLLRIKVQRNNIKIFKLTQNTPKISANN